MRTFLLIPTLFVASSLFRQNTFLESVGIADMDMEDEVNAVIEVKDGFIGTGYSNMPAMPLYKIDFNGQLMWVKKINYGSGSAILKTHDGGFAITGECSPGSGFDGRMCILKFDGNGVLQWTKQYDEGSGSNGRKFLVTGDNGFLIAGRIGPNLGT